MSTLEKIKNEKKRFKPEFKNLAMKKANDFIDEFDITPCTFFSGWLQGRLPKRAFTEKWNNKFCNILGLPKGTELFEN